MSQGSAVPTGLRVPARSVKRRSRARWVWAAALLALLVAAASLAVRRQEASLVAADAMIVSLRKGDLAIDIFETGVIEPNERVEVKSKVAGQVTEVRVEPGDVVQPGQLLLRLDPTDHERDVARSEAAIEQAQATVDFARLTLDRVRSSVDSKVLPSLELQSAEHQLRIALASLRTAQVALSAAQDGVRYTKILAPMAGTVIQRAVDVGEVVTPGIVATFEGRPLLTIADLSSLLVRVELNQIDVAKVRAGCRATARLDALPGKEFAARVSRVAVASTKAPGRDVELFQVELTLLANDAEIKPGMTADVTLHISERASVLLLPIEAVAREHDRSMVTRVLALSNGKQAKERVEIVVGARNDRELEVVSGLSEGDRVLIDPPSAAENETRL